MTNNTRRHGGTEEIFSKGNGRLMALTFEKESSVISVFSVVIARDQREMPL